jgi:hypothetical protein
MRLISSSLLAVAGLVAVTACGGDDPATAASPFGGNSNPINSGGDSGTGGNINGPTSDGGSRSDTGTYVPMIDPSCTPRTINAYGSAPDMLIVMDASLSTVVNGRWEPAKKAVKDITTSFEGLLNFGLQVFPGPGVPLFSCEPGIEAVPLMHLNAAAIGSALDAKIPDGLTPTGATLQQALNILGPRNGTLDSIVEAGYVLLVTDGEPSCDATNTFTGMGDTGQQEAAREAVKALKAANITTFVIGYQIHPNYQGLMNELAQLGGSGSYKAVESADQITAAFKEITKDVVSCEFELSEIPPDPSYVRVTIDTKTLDLNSADGWVINGKKVTLQGQACATLKDGKGHVLNSQVECRILIPG